MEAQFDHLDAADRLIADVLGPKFIGRRYLRYSEICDLGLADSRVILTKWMDAGRFPRAIKIAGPRGRALRWVASEIAQLIDRRLTERDSSTTEKDEGRDVTVPAF
jgi:predicted DNA-binding transcriptional regulator AlpA